jgi:4-hydroxy-3-polyprenylbenzoate decarboxylase
MAGVPFSTSDRDLVRVFKDRYCNGIGPIEVDSGPVKENILTGDEIDLEEFPIPRWHQHDGGRYIDTFTGVVTRDPTTGQLNVGNYRGMITGRNQIGKLMVMSSHWGTHFLQHRETAEPMPVAVVHGWNDALPFCASSPFPKDVCEYDMMAAILQRPVELVRCETSDLMVPANAEMVLEGTISPDPDALVMEGPFGEYPGYLGGSASPKPMLNVHCITHRTNPIMHGALEGNRPGCPSIDYQMCGYSWSAIAWNLLERGGVSGVTDAWAPPVTTMTHLIVQIRKQHRGHAQQVASALWGTDAARWFFKHVIVVEEDIDIRNPEAVEWAIAFRTNAGMGQVITYGPTFGSVLDPSTPFESNQIWKYGTGQWTRLLIDATRNWDLPENPGWNNQRFPPVDVLPVELEERIRERWDEYGLDMEYLTEQQRELVTYRNMAKKLPGII